MAKTEKESRDVHVNTPTTLPFHSISNTPLLLNVRLAVRILGVGYLNKEVGGSRRLLGLSGESAC